MYQRKQSFAQSSLSSYVAQEAEDIINLAIADLDHAIALSPEEALYYRNRGLLYAKELGQYERAINEYNQAIQLNPEYVDTGNAYQKLSEHVTAIGDYDRALELNPQAYGVYKKKGTKIGVDSSVKLECEAIVDVIVTLE